MHSTFKPQMTTLKSFHRPETNLFNKFKSLGFEDKVARTIAHSFTSYMLGYMTVEGVAQAIFASGAEMDEARMLATAFEDAKYGREISSATPEAPEKKSALV